MVHAASDLPALYATKFIIGCIPSIGESSSNGMPGYILYFIFKFRYILIIFVVTSTFILLYFIFCLILYFILLITHVPLIT
jgi:hypothetical protein